MSATARIPALAPHELGERAPSRRRAPRRGPSAGPMLIAFALLSAYGALRWATMLASPPAWRLAGLIALACAIAALGGAAQADDRRLRFAANVAIVIAAVAIVPTAGVPLGWILHARVAATSRAIGDGLSTLPGVLVPYRGGDQWTRVVIMLGAGMLMLGSGLTLATSERPVGEARLVGAALPLIVLATVPSAIATPRHAWLHGLIMFVLLSLFVLRDRVAQPRAFAGASLLAAVAVTAVAVSPALGGHRAWIRVTSPAAPGGAVERFDWAQTYGPLDWPQTGRTVLSVSAAVPYYWKTEDLDAFDGTGWVQAAVGLPGADDAVAPANLRRWTQTLVVTLAGSYETRQVVGAGEAAPPALGPTLRAGVSPGTFVTTAPLVGGDRYAISVYTPVPTAAQLAAAGTDYPLAAIAPELALDVRAAPARTQSQLRFAPYGSSGPAVTAPGRRPAQALTLLERSPYRRVWRLAQRLKADTTTPAQYAAAIIGFLGHGYTYDQDPPAPTSYPLVQFLFGTRLGYCQQFAGAMALLLRMGGVPARVATGFTTGVYDASEHAYIVANEDAHAWVEAWFPSYGWIQFDPTLPADPARGGPLPRAAGAGPTVTAATTATRAPTQHSAAGAATARRRPRSRRPVGTLALALALAVAAVAVLLLALWLGGRALRRRPAATAETRLRELERALGRCGLALGDGITLTALERRFADRPAAAEYIRRIRGARFARGGPEPTPGQRRALRIALGRGHGPLGWARALASLPPRVRRDR